VREFGDPVKMDNLQDWCWRECSNIFFLIETMLTNPKLIRIHNNVVLQTKFVLVVLAFEEALAFGGITLSLMSFHRWPPLLCRDM